MFSTTATTVMVRPTKASKGSTPSLSPMDMFIDLAETWK